MNYVEIIKALIGILSVAICYFLIFYGLFEIHLDWTETDELLLWYSKYQKDGSIKRKFIVLYKRNQR